MTIHRAVVLPSGFHNTGKLVTHNDHLSTRAAPKVKPLVWSQTTDTKKYGFPRRRWRGLAGLGVQYVIWDYDRSEADRVDGWFLVGGLSTFILGSRHDTLNHAKAAAQADYDRRILDALE